MGSGTKTDDWKGSDGLAGRAAFRLGLGGGGEGFYFGGLRFGQAFKDILKIFGRGDAVAAATAHH